MEFSEYSTLMEGPALRVRERLLQPYFALQPPFSRIWIAMRIKLVYVLLSLAFAASVPPVRGSAQTVATSAPVTDVRYEVTFNRTNGEQRVVSSTMTFTVGGNAPVILSL